MYLSDMVHLLLTKEEFHQEIEYTGRKFLGHNNKYALNHKLNYFKIPIPSITQSNKEEFENKKVIAYSDNNFLYVVSYDTIDQQNLNQYHEQRNILRLLSKEQLKQFLNIFNIESFKGIVRSNIMKDYLTNREFIYLFLDHPDLILEYNSEIIKESISNILSSVIYFKERDKLKQEIIRLYNNKQFNDLSFLPKEIQKEILSYII